METSRLRLIASGPEDIQALRLSVAALEARLGIRVLPVLRAFWSEVPESAIGRFIDAPRDVWRHGFWVAHKDDNVVIGACGFKGVPDANGTVEISYGIAPAYENQGYATEAARALTGFAFCDPRVKIVRAHTLVTGNASARVLKKCGLEFVGEVYEPEDGLVARWEVVKRDA